MRVMMPDLHDLQQLLVHAEVPHQSPSKSHGNGDDHGRYMRACAWRNHVEAGRKPLCRPPKQVAPERLHLPRRRDDVDIADVQALIVECSLQRAERELCRMLFAVEPFLLQDDRRHAIVEQRQARVMSPGYNAENVHDEA